MQTLFFKIFGWFWAAMAFIILSVFLVTWLTLRPRTRGEMRNPFAVFGIEAVRVYEREGQAGLAAHLAFLDQHFTYPTFLLDERGNELSGRTVSDEIKAVTKRIENGTPLPRPGETRYFAAPVQGPSGRRYIFVTEQPEPPPGWFSATPQRLAVQILVILLSAGLGCYLLARYLTAPIVQLREATRKLATGDLTARVGESIGKRRDEVTELGADFDRMAEQIESLLNLQRRLLGDISHELRSPLTRLNLALGVARHRAGEPAARAHDRIEREAERLNELIGQLLTLTELESGEQPVKREPIHLAELIRAIAADAEFEAHNLNRAVQVVAVTDCTVNGDEWLLRSAIENIVRNAIRHTAERTAVEITLSCRHTAITISVRDHGSGVPEESLAQLFRPFYRVDDARDRQAGGTGLGLSITERAVRLHGGTVQASNAPGGGLIIDLRLPAF
ncbi:MAG: ATP-binding protein [Blastocatellia bacterium]